MAKKKSISIGDMISDISKDIATTKEDANYIPDIIEFIEKDEWLGLKAQGVELYPFQKIVLKVFYRGSLGNEHLELTEKEMELCNTFLNNDDDGNALEKWESGEIFRELVIVWGRRSGKDFMTSLIALYEACRLLLAPGGSPYEQYGLAEAAVFTILTVASAEQQAHVAFHEISDKLLKSNFFQDKYIPEGIEAKRISLLTPKDRAENAKRKAKGISPTKGSIAIEVGHSNSSSLRGKSVFVCILDEMAFYNQSGGASSDSEIYRGLLPAVKTYSRKKYVFDDEGQPVMDEITGKQKFEPIYEGKIIAISSPNGKDGKFYDLYANANMVDHRFMCRLPTWIVNPNHTEASLRADAADMSEEEFQMEFGGQFSGTAGMNFFNRDDVMKVFNKGVKAKDNGYPGHIYFAHLDPATSSHNYALAICHKEAFVNPETKSYDFKIVVDHLKYWHPTPDKPIQVSDVDNYVIALKKRFNLAYVTYDQWNSMGSINKLNKAGIPAKLARFTQKYKMHIYTELYNLVISEKIEIPRHKLLQNEMINLQKRFSPNGFSVFPKREGDCRSDDVLDAVAGAVFNCMSVSSSGNKLPSGVMASTGMTGQGMGNRVWQGMQGPIGIGGGEQVAKNLANRQMNQQGGFILGKNI